MFCHPPYFSCKTWNKECRKQQCCLFKCCFFFLLSCKNKRNQNVVYLRQIPVVESNNGSDVVLQQMIDQVVVVLHSLFVHMFGWKWDQTLSNQPVQEKTCQLSHTHTWCQWELVWAMRLRSDSGSVSAPLSRKHHPTEVKINHQNDCFLLLCFF